MLGCSSGIEVAVDVERPLSSLTTEETRELCEAVGSYARDRLTRRQLCASKLIAEAQFPMSVPQFSTSVCERFESCQEDPPSPSPYLCTLPCFVEAPSCTATVEEYIACRQTSFDRREDRLNRFVCDEPPPESEGGTNEACVVLRNRCRSPDSPFELERSPECVNAQIRVE